MNCIIKYHSMAIKIFYVIKECVYNWDKNDYEIFEYVSTSLGASLSPPLFQSQYKNFSYKLLSDVGCFWSHVHETAWILSAALPV